MVRPRSPRPTDSPRVPVCSILEGWPTAPLGREGGVVGVVTDGVDAACCPPVDGNRDGAPDVPPGAVAPAGPVVVAAGAGAASGDRGRLEVSEGPDGERTSAPTVPATT